MGARVWLLVGFLGAFGAVIASLCVLFAAYVAHPPVVPDDKMGYCPTRVYPGLAIFLQVRIIQYDKHLRFSPVS